MQTKRNITGGIMSVGVIVTSIFAIMRSNLTEVNMNEVTIVENGERITIATDVETVHGLITEGYIQLGNFDDFSVRIEDYVYDGMEIEITRASPVVINDGGTRFQTMTTATDVFDVLNQHSIELSDDDLVEIVVTGTNALGEEIQVNPTTLLSFEGTEVKVNVTRVTFEEQSTFQEITLATEYIYTNLLNRGVQEVDVDGTPRVEETVIGTKFHNGRFYAIISEEVIVVDEGEARVVLIGTYVPAPPPIPQVNTTTPTESIETFDASVTAYLPDCRGCSGFTASGKDVRNTSVFNDSTFGTVRIIAADRRFPIGTVMYIQDVGNAIVLDRGRSVTGNILDLLMHQGQNPWQFGRQSLQAQVVRLGW